MLRIDQRNVRSVRTLTPSQYDQNAVGAWYNNEYNAGLVIYGVLGLAAYGALTIISQLFSSNDR